MPHFLKNAIHFINFFRKFMTFMFFFAFVTHFTGKNLNFDNFQAIL
jgi:hypothetical protein